tara:strand:- start:3089 stop:3967 length:879 start_codon:yes stop_codon:yes gene_type:complete
MQGYSGVSSNYSCVNSQHIIPQNFSEQILWNDSVFADSIRGTDKSDKDIILPETYSKSDDEIQMNIEKILGFKIHNVHFYKKAFIHKSMQKTTKCSNERLEFLGDAVLNLIIAEYVYNKYEGEDEGFLTKVRTKLVNGKILSSFSKKTKIDELIVTSKQLNTKQKENTKILEDAFEAFIGAIYSDLGMDKTQKFVIELVEKLIDFDTLLIDDNFKDILLRYSQKNSLDPEYEVTTVEGPPHKREFTIVVKLNKKEYSIGKGSTKKNAEQEAAKKTLMSLGVNLKDSIKDSLR